ncbi:phosphate ABC transporter permease subunit PstC [Oceanibacterium hippocampi]|uniref:Phosphate transport system permease protein n=1 Tax=Oceanibacterium hippocampi TaxID=745714 RepID=A0A1Y5SG39_9PROT|nr:phosphate ABC transporter permease subunit PstC [Oceanibacterium hippocampi]SLN36903.1 Phosphate transport system permease protein PstC [Oceanibacterium hippocampi]
MPVSTLAIVLVLMALSAFYMGRRRATAAQANGGYRTSSRPHHHGLYLAIWVAIPAALVAAFWLLIQGYVIDSIVLADLPPAYADISPDRLNLLLQEIHSVAGGGIVGREVDDGLRLLAERYHDLSMIGDAARLVLVLGLAIGAFVFALRRISPRLQARERVEKVIMIFLIVASTISILTTVGIVLSLLFETMRFFDKVPITEFLFGLNWSPQTALRSDQVGSSGAFGAVPLFAGTLLITLIAMLVAVPIGLMSAVYMTEFASPRFRATVKPLLEILAGVPTVVYGFFAALTVGVFFRDLGDAIGLDIVSESALAAGVVMGVMIIPFVSSLSDDVINAVPQSLRDGSYGLGATRAETIRLVILPAALPGIVGAVMLAISRAIGETMIVVMAAGFAANLTANPLEAVTTVTVQIVGLLVGDQEFDSAKTLAAFALALVLFLVTLGLNVMALMFVRKYREKYD